MSYPILSIQLLRVLTLLPDHRGDQRTLFYQRLAEASLLAKSTHRVSKGVS